MNFGKVFGLVFLSLSLGVTAHAQVGVYVGYSATQYSGVECLATTCSNGTVFSSGSSYGQNGSITPTGVMGGAYYDFKTYGPVRLGVDLRLGNNHANKSASSGGGGAGLTSGSYFLGGVRGTVRTPVSWLRPYAQISAGYARSNVTEPTCETSSGGTVLCTTPATAVSSAIPRYTDNFLQYEGFIGADIHVLPVVDLRAVELGIGNMNRIGSGSAYDGSSSVGIKSIGAGVVFHLP